LKYYQIEPMASKFTDPYQFNTFGNLLKGDGLSVTGGPLTMQTPAPAKWIAAIVARRLGRQALSSRKSDDL